MKQETVFSAEEGKENVIRVATEKELRIQNDIVYLVNNIRKTEIKLPTTFMYGGLTILIQEDK